MKLNTCLILLIAILIMQSCSQEENINQETKFEDVIINKEDRKDWPESFGFGEEASAGQIAKWDIDVRPDGEGLPEGSGTVSAGKTVYFTKCASCHGTKTSDGTYDRLFGYDEVKMNPDSLKKKRKTKTIGTYWPYATTLYDYINRAMPFTSPGSLTSHEVYSVTAYLLYVNDIIDEGLILTAKSLPKVKMPAQGKFVNDDRKGGPEIR
jgi:hypothetical protein